MAVVVSLGVPLALSACLLFVITGLTIKQTNIGRQPIWVHESSIVALFGLLLGGVFKYLTQSTISFDSDLFFYLVLPPIIFSAGYSLKRKKFFRYGVSITVFGILGTVVNFVLISLAARLFAVLYGIEELSWSSCMLLGSVLSATDEVSAMSFIKMKDFPQLGALIFGEGVLNDSLSIVLFKSISDESGRSSPSSTLTHLNPMNAIINVFIKVIFQLLFSSMIGIGCGLVCAFVFKLMPSTRQHPIHQTSLILLFGLLAYSLAECFHLSGIVTIFMSGVTLAHYAWYSLTHSAQVTTKVTLCSMSDIAEGFAFAYVGLSLWGFTKDNFHIPLAVYLLVMVILARIVTIFGLCYLLTPISNEFNLPLREKIGFILGGIVRGCLCWAQILQLRGEGDMMLITTTLLIVMTTIVGCGVLLPAVIPKLIASPSSASAVVSLSSTTTNPNTAAAATTASQFSHNNNLFGKTYSNYDRNYLANSYQNISLFQENATAMESNNNNNNQTIINDTRMNFADMNHSRIATNNMTTITNHANESVDISLFSEIDEATNGNASPHTLMKKTKQEFAQPHNRMSSLLHVLWVRFDENIMKPIFGGSQTGSINEQSIRSEILHRTEHMSIWYMITHSDEVRAIFDSDLSILSDILETNYGNNENAQRNQLSFDDEFLSNLIVDDEYFEMSSSNHNSNNYNTNSLSASKPTKKSVVIQSNSINSSSGNLNISSSSSGYRGPTGSLSPINLYSSLASNSISTPIRRTNNNNNNVSNSNVINTNNNSNNNNNNNNKNNNRFLNTTDHEAFEDVVGDADDIALLEYIPHSGHSNSNAQANRAYDYDEHLHHHPRDSRTSGTSDGNRDSIGEFFAQQLQGTIVYQSTSPIPHVHEV